MKNELSKLLRTYTNVRINETHDVKWVRQEHLNLIENYQQKACRHPINSFEPLPVKLIRIAWVVAVAKGSLSSRYVVILDSFKSAHKYDVSKTSSHQRMASAYVWKKLRYDAQVTAKTIRRNAVPDSEIWLSLY
jgi:hypothetical protein